MNLQIADALREMVFNHSVQHGVFPAIVIIDLETSRRLKQQNYNPWASNYSISQMLDDKVRPSTFMGIPVEVIE